jgi:DNA-binding Xre family transcriptional regulator
LAIKNKLLVLMAERKIRSLKSMSRISGINYNTVRKFSLQQVTRFDSDTVEDLCKALDCDIKDLLYIEEKKEA